MLNKRTVGSYGESIAIKALKRKSYEILETNFTCRHGEIDIICKSAEYIVFVEVKYRRSLKYGLPREAVPLSKQKKIRTTANYYAYTKELNDSNFRFDVVEIIDTEKLEINHIENAFW